MPDPVRPQVRVDEQGNPWRDVGFGTDDQGVPNTPLPISLGATSLDASSIGAKSDAVATTDTGTFSLIALFKRLLQKLTNGIGVTGTFWQTTQPVSIASSPADVTSSGIIDSNGETLNPTLVQGGSDLGFQITGTWSGQLEFEITIDGTNFVATRARSESGDDAVNATTVNGVFVVPIAGAQGFRVRASSWSSGAANIFFRASVGQHTVNIASPIPSGQNIIGGVTQADGANVSLGAKADSVATTDTGTFSSIALFKRLLSRLTDGAFKFMIWDGVDSAEVNSRTDGKVALEVNDDCGSFEAKHITLVAATDTTVTFAQPVRIVRIMNWDTANRLLVKNSAITGVSDADATRVGFAPTTSVPGTRTLPYKTSSIHLMSAGTGEVSIEGYF